MKRGGSLSFLVATISNVLVMEIGRTEVGSGGYILVSCAHSNTSFPSLLNAASLIHIHGKEYLMQFYIIKFVSGLWQFCVFSPVLWFPPPIQLITMT